jgi:hypothetical protein
VCTGNWCIFIVFVTCENTNVTCEITNVTWFNVLPVDSHIVVSLCCTLHVIKSQCMQEFMYNCGLPQTSVALEVQFLALWVIENLWLNVAGQERHCVFTRSLIVFYISDESKTSSQRTGEVSITCQSFLSFVKPSNVRMCGVTVSVLSSSVILGRSQLLGQTTGCKGLLTGW